QEVGSREQNVEASRRSVSVELEEEETRELLQKVPGVYHTQINDALLTALGQSLGEWMGAEGVLVDMEGHGREEVLEGMDVSRTVGWFTSIYPVVLPGRRGLEVGDRLKRVKEQLRKVPNRGFGYGVLRYGGGAGGDRERWKQLPEAEIIF